MGSADWMPGIDHDPGENAGYRAGEADMVSMVIHYTAGAYGGDYAVGKRGYFNFYCPRDRPAVQFAEANAVTFHAGAWNGLGPGIELERRDDSVPYTDHQLSDLGDIARWLHGRYGIPLTFYDTGGDNSRRIGVDESRGLSITHRSLAQQGGWHSDYVTADEWAHATGGASDQGDFTVDQMDTLAAWEKDTRKIILEQLIGDYDQGKYTGILATWEKDTRAYVDKAIKESEARIIAAVNAAKR